MLVLTEFASVTVGFKSWGHTTCIVLLSLALPRPTHPPHLNPGPPDHPKPDPDPAIGPTGPGWAPVADLYDLFFFFGNPDSRTSTCNFVCCLINA
eukprot:scaffold121136_cov19-Prasinocladus_malaysianus.AAC.5